MRASASKRASAPRKPNRENPKAKWREQGAICCKTSCLNEDDQETVWPSPSAHNQWPHSEDTSLKTLKLNLGLDCSFIN